MNAPSKQVRQLLDEVRRHRPDAEWWHGGKHIRLRAASLSPATIPTTPGRGRSMANTRAQLRRQGYLP